MDYLVLWFSLIDASTCKSLKILFFLSSQEEAIAEGVDDEEELEELRARLAKVRS